MSVFKFCPQCNNILYTKEDKKQKILLYACRNCDHQTCKQELWRHENMGKRSCMLKKVASRARQVRLDLPLGFPDGETRRSQSKLEKAPPILPIEWEVADNNRIYRNEIYHSAAELTQVLQDVASDPTVPRTKSVRCVVCGHEEVAFLQATSREEGMELFYVCCNSHCGHRWRD